MTIKKVKPKTVKKLTKQIKIDILKKEFEKTKFNKVGAFDTGEKKLGYAESIRCSNCSWSSVVYIPFGIKIKQYLKGKVCERCKCEGTLF